MTGHRRVRATAPLLLLSLALAGSGVRANRCCSRTAAELCRPFKPSAEPCIARDSSLVLMGDSIMRFQYLDLVYRLEYGAANTSFVSRRERNPLKRGTWPSWLSFFRGTEAELRGGNETCDCHRTDLRKQPTLYRTTASEVRSYTWAACNASVHFVMVNDGALVRGHHVATGVLTDAQWAAHARARHGWELSWAETIRLLAPRMRPTALVLNTGLWPSAHALDFRALRDVAMNATRCSFWRTTTSRRDGGRSDARPDAATRVFAKEYVIEASSVLRGVNVSYIWDNVHFQPASGVYERLNAATLARANSCALGCNDMRASTTMASMPSSSVPSSADGLGARRRSRSTR